MSKGKVVSCKIYRNVSSTFVSLFLFPYEIGLKFFETKGRLKKKYSKRDICRRINEAISSRSKEQRGRAVDSA